MAMAERTPKYRELLKRLKLFGVVEDRTRGKGSERSLSRIVEGKKYSTTTNCHSESVCRRLKLTAEDGVADEEFYGK